MKKIILTSLIVLSQIALTGCDSPEGDTLTFEVAIIDLDGKTQNFKKDCKHTQVGCFKSFKINTPNGERDFYLQIENEPTEENYLEFVAQLKNISPQEADAGSIVLSEYAQTIIVSGTEAWPKSKKKNWKPGERRTESLDIVLSNHRDIGIKVGTAEVKVY